MAQSDAVRPREPEPVARPARRLRPKRVALISAALILALLALPLLVEFRVPLNALRADIARHARDASGLELRFEGPLYLVTGLRPGVEVRDLVIAGGHEQTSVEILRLGVGRAEIELPALFAHEVRLRRVRAANLGLRLDARALAALARAERRERAPGDGGWRFVDVTRVDVTHARIATSLAIDWQAPDIVVDSMTLHATAGAPLRIEAQGSVTDEPMHLNFHTASLAKLRGDVHSIPIEFAVTLADASLKGSGAFDVDAERGEYRIAATGSGRFLERALPGFQAALGEVKNVSLEGLLRTTPESRTLESATLVAGRTRAQGEFRQSVEDGRVRTHSRLEFEALDLQPWLPLLMRDRPAGSSKLTLLDAVRGVQKIADVEFDLKATRLVWPQREAHDVEAKLRLDREAVTLQGGARMPPGTARLDARLETAQREARLRIDAQAGPIALEALHPRVADAGIAGRVQAAKISAHARGVSTTALVQSIEGTLELHDAELRWRPEKDAAAMQIKIDRAALAATHDRLDGSFAASLDDARIALKLQSERAEAQTAQRRLQSTFDLTMTRTRQRGLRLAAAGTLSLDPQIWALEVKQAALGASRGSFSAKGAWKEGAPLSLRAVFDEFDAAALEFFDFSGAGTRPKETSWENLVILPSGLRFPAADFELSAQRLEVKPARFSEVRLAGRSRAGRLEATRFELRDEGGTLRGELSADLSGTLPQLQVSASGTDFDARGLLKRFGLQAHGASAKRLEAKFDLRGARLKEIVAQSSLRISTEGLVATLPGLVDARRRLAFEGKVEAASTRGQVHASAQGSLNGKPFHATSRGPALAALIARAERVPLDVSLSASGSRLELHGTIAKGPAADVRIRLEAKQADELLAFAGIDGGPRAALAASAEVKLTPPARLSLASLEVQLGASRLAGSAVADWSGKRPRVEAELSGPALHLGDLGFGARELKNQFVSVPKSGAGASPDPAWLATLRQAEGKVDLRVESLFAAGEPVGRLKLGARLDSGRLRIAPLVIRETQASLTAEGEIDARAALPTYALQAELHQYDLTELLRAFDPEARGSASVDARATLRSRGVGESVIANLEGSLDVAGYGSDVGAGALASLHTGLLDLAMRTVDRSSASKVNCAVGVFHVERGKMTSRALFIDTTRLRFTGSLDVDLVTHAIDGGLRPHPKNPRLFAVNTPVSLSGTIEDPKFSLATSALPELLIRYSNPFTMFLGLLTEIGDSNPDDSEECRAAYAKTKEARPETPQRGSGPFKFLPWH